MFEYNEFRYLYPSRPDSAIPEDMLGFYKREGWQAQVKKNGTCSVVFVYPSGEWHVMTRHNTEHRAWKPEQSQAQKFFKDLDLNAWYVFSAELLHSKGPTKDTLYIYDILVAENKLLSETFQQRQELLYNMFSNHIKDTTQSHWVLDRHVWLARNHSSKFKSLHRSLEDKEDEGIVLKDPESTYNWSKKTSDWQVKCRVNHENYSF